MTSQWNLNRSDVCHFGAKAFKNLIPILFHLWFLGTEDDTPRIAGVHKMEGAETLNLYVEENHLPTKH